MPPTQDPQTTFKPKLTCIFLSARTRYNISIPNGWPCTNWDVLLSKTCYCSGLPQHVLEVRMTWVLTNSLKWLGRCKLGLETIESWNIHVSFVALSRTHPFPPHHLYLIYNPKWNVHYWPQMAHAQWPQMAHAQLTPILIRNKVLGLRPQVSGLRRRVPPIIRITRKYNDKICRCK